MNKTAKDLAKEVLEDTIPGQLDEMMKDETNIKIFQIMGNMGAQKGETGALEFTVKFGRECWNQGREEMKKELAEKLSK